MMNNNTISKSFRLIIVGFNLFTILLYATAPLHYSSSGGFVLSIIYLLFACFLINKGFNAGERKDINSECLAARFLYQPTEKLIRFVFVFYSLTFLIKYAYYLRFSPVDIKGMFLYLSAGIVDPVWAYKSAINDTRPYTISWSVYFLLSIIDQMFFIFGFLTYRRQKTRQKILFGIFFIIEVFYWRGRATNFGVIALVLGLFVTTMINNGERKRISKRRIILLLLIGVIAFIAAVFFFGSTMDSRTGGADATSNFTMTKGGIFNLLPEEFWSPYYYVVSYLCQGYYNLSLAFSINHFDWTFGLGNNPALISLSDFLFGTDLMNHTYMKSLDVACHVDEFVAWHSAYLWWANDFTIPGALLIVYFLSYIAGFSFKLSSKYGDFLSKIVCTVSACMLIMLFANNTYLSNVFYSYMFLFPLWFFTRYRKRI